MLVRILVALCLILPPAAAAMAQAPPAPAPSASSPGPAGQAPAPADQQSPGRTLCEQNVGYHLADLASVPEQYRRFVGIWSDAAWDARSCAALIVEDVKPDATASIIYVFGPEGSDSAVPGGVLHGTGVIRRDELRFQNADGSQFAFRPGIVDMTGHWINPKGESFQATFKQTP